MSDRNTATTTVIVMVIVVGLIQVKTITGRQTHLCSEIKVTRKGDYPHISTHILTGTIQIKLLTRCHEIPKTRVERFTICLSKRKMYHLSR